ncbi:hypothetical protein Tco_0274348 [Tanacetum coccineum]
MFLKVDLEKAFDSLSWSFLFLTMECESVRAFATRNLIEHLSTDLLSTYKGLMKKSYTWIEAREVATNGAPNDLRDNFKRSRKPSWDNGRGHRSRDRLSPY